MKRTLLPMLAVTLSALTFSAGVVVAQTGQSGPAGQDKPSSSASHILNCLQPRGHQLYYKDYSCPVGGERFRSLTLGYGRYLDFKPVPEIDSPMPALVCPANGFVITKLDYSAEELKKYTAVIESETYKSIYRTQHPSYYLRAKFDELAGEGAENRWWYLLQATWEAETCLSDQYSFYADEAIKALQSSKSDKSQSWAMDMIISDLYRRTGRFELAQQWLDKIGGPAASDPEMKEDIAPFIALQQGAINEKQTTRIDVERARPK